MARFLTSSLGAFLLGWLFLGSVSAYSDVNGYQLNRYEPTASGEWSFFVDHPWYSSMRYFSGGITLDYAHNPLVTIDSTQTPPSTAHIIEHQLQGHVDLAASFLDRVLLTFSLPITFFESGDTTPLNHNINPTDSVAVGDPRLGLMVRIFGQPYKDAVSLSGGADFWIPINSATHTFSPQEAESAFRFRIKAMLGGLKHHVLWSFLAAYYYRPDGVLGDDQLQGNLRSSELQLGAAIAYADTKKRFSIGPELLFSTTFGADPHSQNQTAFTQDFSTMELLLGFHYNIARQVQLSAGVGTGFFHGVGTPDARALLRLSYAPMRKEPAPKKPIPQKPPEVKPIPSDRDGDGVLDKEDLCPDVHQGSTPDPNRKGCPAEVKAPIVVLEISDLDKDGIPDDADDCPKDAGPKERKGCPIIKNVNVTEDKFEINGKIQFATNRWEIIPNSKSTELLDSVVAALKIRPRIKLRIEGHTDNKGKPQKNLVLSKQRAASVREYLVQHGIAADRLTSEGFGDTRPVADNKKAKGRDQNRRTEFTIIR